MGTKGSDAPNFWRGEVWVYFEHHTSTYPLYVHREKNIVTVKKWFTLYLSYFPLGADKNSYHTPEGGGVVVGIRQACFISFVIGKLTKTDVGMGGIYMGKGPWQSSIEKGPQ